MRYDPERRLRAVRAYKAKLSEALAVYRRRLRDAYSYTPNLSSSALGARMMMAWQAYLQDMRRASRMFDLERDAALIYAKS